jgi:hypothetical protein
VCVENEKERERELCEMRCGRSNLGVTCFSRTSLDFFIILITTILFSIVGSRHRYTTCVPTRYQRV